MVESIVSQRPAGPEPSRSGRPRDAARSAAEAGEAAPGGGVSRVELDGATEVVARPIDVALAGVNLPEARVGAGVAGVDAHRLLERLDRLVETIEVLQVDPE